MTRNKALQHYQNFMDMSAHFRADMGAVPTSFYFLMEDDRLVLVPLPSSLDNAGILIYIQTLAGHLGAQYVLSVTETWMKTNEGNIEIDVALKEDPDAVEVLLATIDGAGLQRRSTARIHPDGSLGPFVPTEGLQLPDMSGAADFN